MKAVVSHLHSEKLACLCNKGLVRHQNQYQDGENGVLMVHNKNLYLPITGGFKKDLNLRLNLVNSAIINISLRAFLITQIQLILCFATTRSVL